MSACATAVPRTTGRALLVTPSVPLAPVSLPASRPSTAGGGSCKAIEYVATALVLLPSLTANAIVRVAVSGVVARSA